MPDELRIGPELRGQRGLPDRAPMYRLLRVHTLPGPPPAVLPDKPGPSGWGSEDLAQPLSQDRQAACRHVAILGGCEHLVGGIYARHTSAVEAALSVALSTVRPGPRPTASPTRPLDGLGLHR